MATNKSSNNGFSVNLLPKFYQTNANKKFLQSTVDQLYQPGTLTKTSGYIGRKNAKASTGKDIYVAAADQTRQNYQLEPSITIKDALDNVTFFKDYQDYINQINVFGGNTSNHARLNSQEFYSWDPHIDWDKFVNFQNYYWLPYGPETITVYGHEISIASAFSVEVVADGSNNQYVFTPDGFTPDPVLTLYKGQTYTFNINSPGNPFSIKTARSTGIDDRYSFLSSIDNYGVEVGTMTFTVPNDAPTLLYYQSENDINLGGMIQIYDLADATSINVEAELIGKSSYTLSNGTPLSNGMKLAFKGNVIPSSYASGEYYVEGVGTAISLIRADILEIVSPFTTSQQVEFDNVPFDKEPFDTASGYAGELDYILINRASKDHNPWSRYNRWFHKDVITASANYNKATLSLDQSTRAKRPIIEFHADLRLFNFGTTAVTDVDLVDNFTSNVFYTIEGSAGYNVDQVQLQPGMLVLFTADQDPLVKDKIFRVEYLNVLHLNSGSNQIHLVEVSTPVLDQTVLVKQGATNQGSMYWYDGSTWNKAQQKTTVNQPPLFDIFDSNKISFGNKTTYVGSTFIGTPIFSYKQGTTGTADTVLGFPLSYLNVSNIGDIVFNFNLSIDTFEYKNKTTNVIQTQTIDVGFLSSLDYRNNTVYLNGWQKCNASEVQAAIRIFDNSGLTNNFIIDIYDDNKKLDDLVVKVYVNGKRLAPNLWTLDTSKGNYVVVLNTDIALTDVLTLRTFSKQPINSNGFYEIPLNLQNNPLNEEIGDFTLGEVTDHVNTIVDNLTTFTGSFPGDDNLRDLGNVTQYGTKFVQHSGPMSLALYHIASESNNVVKALNQAKNDYNNFKRLFVNTASTIGVHADPVKIVELVLNKINANKPNVAPYYLSDMVPYGASITTVLDVVDYRIRKYPLTNPFNLDTMSNKAVGIYLNGMDGTQLLYGSEYTFDAQGFVEILPSVNLQTGDTITTVEYDSTDGSFVPATPTKLGLWPKFEPKKYLDTTLLNPQYVLQGHDGSVILAYNDYRDDVILELEKRIYNNIKVNYDSDIFDIKDVIPNYNRTTDYSRQEYNNVLSTDFYAWVGLIGKDLTTPLNYDRSNSFTYNYSLNTAPDGTPVPGYWRGVYRWLLDTDRPNICPWEMLGFSVQPAWWSSTYGDAPYTSDNIPMWTDIANGIIRVPGQPLTVDANYAKPFLLKHIPVDSSGNLISPQESGLASGLVQPNIDNNFVFGDGSPVETAWARSSYYPFSVMSASVLLKPAKTFGVLLDRSNIQRNLAGQLVYANTGLRIRPKDIILPSVYSSASRVQTAGLINYVVDLIFNYIFSNDIAGYNSYLSDLSTMSVQLSYRVGSFTNKDQFNLLLESKTPSSLGNVFIPPENYKVFLNKSSPVEKLSYSGVIITKLSTGYEIKGYSISQPYFNYYQYTSSGAKINVGGISESYSEWAPGQSYIVGNIVLYNGKYYRATIASTSSSSFDHSVFASLPSLPMIGGVTATMRTGWARNETLSAPYGTLFKTAQEVVDFLLGHGEWLKDTGFIFDTYNSNLNTVSNWETSAREFLFWSTQNWSTGQSKWSDWDPTQKYNYGTIVRYDGDYYSAVQTVLASPTFEFEKWTLLPGLSVEGASVISLSPGANAIQFVTNLSVVDSITNSFNTYEIFKVDGTPFEAQNLDSYRQGNSISYNTRTADGIYGASFYLVQNEHVVIIDNSTIFNDVIYNPASGYRQERLKISGYVTTDWYGGLDIPGFIFDSAVVNEWQTWKDYNVGDVVSYQSYYYSANVFIPGTVTFDPTVWTKLDSKPVPSILPNWTNIATQFTDFYGLEVDSFNSAQQKMAQHLVGYQKRQYLNNIIQDDVSEFKFFQGMVREKGTQNVLNKLFGVLNNDNVESLTFYEEWAIRVAQYGATNAFEDIEFVLDESKYSNNPQGTLLTNSTNSNVNPFIIQQTQNDVYVKPLGYNSNPFPVLPTVVVNQDSSVTSVNQFLRSAGYVKSEDVFASLGHISDLAGHPATKISVGLTYKILSIGTTDFTLIGASSNTVGESFVATGVATGTGTVAIDIASVNEGAYFWCAFDGPNSWNVYRFTDIQLRITDVSYKNNVLVLTTQYDAPVSAGSYIGLGQIASLEGFYKIDSVVLNKISITAPHLKVTTPLANLDNLTVYSLLSQRTDYIDNIDTIIPPRLEDGSMLWTDFTDSKTNNWSTWTYNKVYEQTLVNSPVVLPNINFSSFVAINKAGNISASLVGTTQVATYDKISNSVPWTQRQLIQPPFSTSGIPASNTVVTNIAFSPDGTWMATGSPTVSYSSTHYVGVYNPSGISYVTNDIISYQGNFYQALFPVPVGETPSQNSVFWNQLFYIPVSSTASNSTNVTSNGMITLYQKDANNNYQFVDSILSPSISSENFGSNLVFDANNLYISAPSNSNNKGRVYKLSYTSTPLITAIYDEVNSSGTTLKLTSTSGINAGMVVSGLDILGQTSAFTSGQVVEYVLTKLLFTPVPNSINNIFNTSSTSINISKIIKDAAVTLFVNGYNYNIPNITVASTGLTSVNVLSSTHTLVSGGVLGTNSLNVSLITGIAVGNLVVGKGIPTGSYVGAITPANGSFKITLVDFVGAIQNFIVQGSGSYQFYTITTYSYVEIRNQKDLTIGNTALPITTVRFGNPNSADSGLYLADPTLTFTVYSIESSNTVVLSQAPDLTPKGELTFSSVSWQYSNTYSGEASGNYFGNQLALSTDGSMLAISATGGNVGKVYVYESSSATPTQTLTGLLPTFGQSVTLSDDGTWLAVSDNLQSDTKINQEGTVGIYEMSNNGHYQHVSNLVVHNPEDNGEFGTKISFMNDAQTLVVFSKNGSSTTHTSFDLYSKPLKSSLATYNTPYVNDSTSNKADTNTTFDKKSTTFTTTQIACGRVDIYDKYNTSWVYSESLDHTYDFTTGYGQGFAVGTNNIFVGIPLLTVGSVHGQGRLQVYTKPAGALSWNISATAVNLVDVTKIKKAFLYDSLTNNLLTYIDVIDPLQGKIAGPAEEEIKYKSFYDPATYSYSNGADVTVNAGGSWNATQKGQLWWDLRTTKFITPNYADPAYRNNTWNTLAPGASVDVYEWVASTLLPSQWDAQSSTVTGNTLGITGTTLYGDSAYSMTKTYNSVTKTFKNTYYYWVKNKTNIPRVAGRNISGQAVADLIANPKGQGYSYLALIGTDSYSLVNVGNYLNGKNTVLAVEFWTTDKIHQNIHSQWKLISTDDIVQLPAVIKQKWIDSLCGVDSVGRSVPDVLLPAKLKYGIENRPRQSMFVNRVEALKEYIEGVNAVLIENQIVNNYDISDLYAKDPEPNIITGLFDNAIDTDADLLYANINLFVRPVLQPVIQNGRIVGITILNTGRGYLQAPYVQISGSGQDARVRANIDTLGRIQSFEILSQGIGYDDNTTATVRDYSVLIHSDSTAGNAWSIYSFDPTYKDNTGTIVGKWSKTFTQAYDVTQYWSKADWYATGYNQFTAPDYSVQLFVDLTFLTANIGDIVKVTMATSDQWMLLEKYTNSSSSDWTLSYKVIGIQEGTIQFNTSIYQTDFSAVGYDASTFDSGAFDVKASTELRIILTALQDKILVGSDLYKKYLDLFFRSIKYAHSEQLYIDWVFKTSFVRATHNVGGFTQPVYYPVDNLSNFQDYVAEVKPYRTKIREYISQYTNTSAPDESSSAVTDFDLPPALYNGSLELINSFVVDGTVSVDNPIIETYPWKFWLDNVGFKVVDLQIVSGGSGYVTQPNIVFTSNSGSGATAQAFFTNGVINRVILITHGDGYLSAPTVTVDGGLAVGGTPARIVAIIGDTKVRSNKTAIKFDRIGYTNYIDTLDTTEVFTGSGSQLTFNLTWAPDIKLGTSSVVVYNTNTAKSSPLLQESYTLMIVKNKVNGETQYSGKITFTTALQKYEIATLSYKKDVSLLNAIDRINFYYNPISGMIGKELNQLMTGVDYGGTIVGNLGFNTGGGWGDQPFSTDKWDSFDPTYNDYTVVQGNTILNSWTLPYVPASGTPINVYWKEYISYQYDQNSNPPVDGVNTLFPYSIFLYASVFLTNVVNAISSSGISTTAVVTQNNDYPISTTTVAVANGTGGLANQASILVDNPANIIVGQFVSGTGVSYNTTVVGILNNQIILSQNLTEPATGNVYSFFVLGSTLTVSSTLGITVDLGVVGTGFTTQVVTKLIDANTVQLSSPPSLIPVANDAIIFVNNAAGTTVLSVATTANISIGDSVSCTDPALQNVFGLTTKVISIDSPTQVTISQILYANISNGTSITFRKDLVDPIDVNLTIAGYAKFTNPPPAGSIVNIVGNLDSVRIDDSEYGTPSQTNPNALMATIYANGHDGTVSIPNTIPTNTNDIFIFRQETSDGSVIPVDRDTDISGGDLAYSTAQGILADDIVVDGDGFVTETSSPAPEEIVPGQVVDTLAIKVFDRPTSGSARIKVDNFIGDGSTNTFTLTQQPVTVSSIIVKVTEPTGINPGLQTLNVDYTLDFELGTITFVDSPALGSFVTIFNIGYAGENILDLDYFVSDGLTSEFITQAPWLDSFTASVFVDGVPAEVIYFKTDTNYILDKSIGIRFDVAPPANALINFIIVSGVQQTFAITSTERVYPNGSSSYKLNNLIGNSLPNETYMIVRVDQQILPAPVNSYFVISGGNLVYTLSPNRVPPFSVDSRSISVLVGNSLLLAGRDYFVDLSVINITITSTAYNTYVGSPMVVSVSSPNSYTYNASTQEITFSQAYDSSHVIEITSSYQHDTISLERTEVIVESASTLTVNSPTYYAISSVAGGLIVLERPVIDENYVWVTLNSTLLVPGADYRLNDDKTTIQLAAMPSLSDKIEVLTFGSDILKTGIAYVQFKDMLNRTSYTRLSAEKRTTLAQPLLWTDTSIVLTDGTNFQEPSIQNKIPGVIEIQGERIEYYVKNGNVLSQLRRSILGTGMALSNPAGTYVQDISSSERIPYNDTITTSVIVSDGTNIINLDYVPTRGSTNDSSGIVKWFSDYGYTYRGQYDTATTYSIKDVVKYVDSYYYCTKSVPSIATRLSDVDYSPAGTACWSLYGTTIPFDYGQCDEVEVFVGGYNNVGDWAESTSYTAGVLVNHGSYTYRCVEDHTSSSFDTDKNSGKWVFFIGNIRLKKQPYSVFNVNVAPYSPAGDVRFDADFSVNGTDAEIRLTNTLQVATHVTVYKRTGVIWDSATSILEDSSTIAQFIKSKPGIWYAEYNQISNTSLGLIKKKQITFDAPASTFDDGGLTFDQG